MQKYILNMWMIFFIYSSVFFAISMAIYALKGEGGVEAILTRGFMAIIFAIISVLIMKIKDAIQ